MSRSFAKFAGTLSFLQGFLYIISVLALFAIPYSQNQIYSVTLFSSFICLAFIGFMTVAPATALLFSEVADWAMMGKNLALLCLSVTMIYFSWLLVHYTNQQIPQILDQLTIFRWIGWFTFGGLGLWVAIVGWLAFITKKLPRSFILPCLIKVLGFWIILIGIFKGSITIAQVGVLMGALIGGPWYHGMLGYYLWKDA